MEKNDKDLSVVASPNFAKSCNVEIKEAECLGLNSSQEVGVQEVGVSGISEDMSFPEGGIKAWLVVLGSWCGMIAVFGISNAIGAIQYELSVNQLSDHSESKISWIFSLWLWLCFFGGAQAGPIFDAYGAHVLIIPGAIFYTASIMILSVCKEYYQFILGFSILGGLSSSIICNPCITAVGHWFKRRRAFATGLAASGGAIGGVMFPLALNKMIKTMGYGWAVRILGFIVMFLLIICILTVRDRHNEMPRSQKGVMLDFSSFKEKQYAWCVAGIFFCEWAIFCPLNYLKIYATRNGMSSDAATNALAYFNTASVFGRALPGYFADILGSYNVMVVTAAMSGVACLCIWLPGGHTSGGLIAFAVVFGFFSGSTISLTPVCVSRISKTSEYGRRYGTCYTVGSFSTLSGLPIGGALESHNFLGLILFCGLCYVIGAGSFLATRMVEGHRHIARF